MLTTIKGIYKNGEIKLDEKTDIQNPMQVMVTLMEEVKTGEKNVTTGGLRQRNSNIYQPRF